MASNVWLKSHSPPSTASLSGPHSIRSNRPSTIRTVVTSPPWAKDEPPSPDDDDSVRNHSETRPSDVASYHSSNGHPGFGSHWWAFTHPRPSDQLHQNPLALKHERKGFKLKDRSMSWRPSTRGKDPDTTPRPEMQSDCGSLRISLPTPVNPAQHPFTLAHNSTPGWDTPWTPRVAGGSAGRNSSYMDRGIPLDEDNRRNASPWQKRKRRLRSFILTNPHAPLLFRFVNITFTAAALAVAIRIRALERRYHVEGAVGCSPTLVVIFAPLTLVHVIGAIYLEYFGRPLGLWRTSGKLAHTLSEVLFICAWSAALSLSFDNFFTSLMPCASASFTSWYNQLPRPSSPIPDLSDDSVADQICDGQLALISLVCVGLIMYCTNLVISLFRIFEKVKYMPNGPLRA